MPIVSVTLWPELGEDRIRQLIRGITDSFVQVGIPAQAVQVVIQEVPRTHWGMGGQAASERPRPEGGQASQRPPRTPHPERAQRATRPTRTPGPARTDTRPGKRPRRGGPPPGSREG